jgi:hypothetical protein
MITLTKKRRLVTEVHRQLVFGWRKDHGASYSFPCDELGHVDEMHLAHSARENLLRCRAKIYDVYDGQVECWESHYYEPAEGRCRCGRIVRLDDAMTNTCECGREYNGSGQELAPRSQWGEETGETEADIMGPALYGEELG